MAGWNTLVFCVTHPVSTIGLPANPTGLRTEIAGTAHCCAGCAELHCPSNLVVEVCTNGPAPHGDIVNYPPPAAFSHCGVITNVVCLPPAGSFFPRGTHTVACTATDSLGNTATCSFQVIVRPDFTPPFVLQCPPLNVSVTGCPPVMPDLTASIVAFDNCTGPGQLAITQTILPGTPLPPGNSTVIVRVCDQGGNCRDCDVIVAAVPSLGCCTTTPLPEIFSGRNPSGPLPGGSLDPQFKTGVPLFTTPNPVVLTNPPPAWMANSTSSKWIGPAQPYDYAPAGVFFYTNRFFLCSTNQAQLTGRWTADDFARILLNGVSTTNAILNFWSCTNWVAVSINSGFVPGWNELVFAVTNVGTSPTGLRTEITGSACCGTCVAITCPPNLTTNICANSVAVSYSAPTVSSACAAISSVQCTPPSGSTFPPGVHGVTCTALDTQGNAAQCRFTVNVVRLAPPLAVTCPPDQTLFTCGSTAVAFYKANAAGQSGSVICTPPSGSTFPLGTNVVTCQAVSPCGDTATCSFKVVVKPSVLGPPSAVFTGGTPDNFVFPMEVVTPDPCVVTAFQSSSWKWFDDKARDHYLAYRFTGLPANIVQAEVVFRMRPTTSVGTGNDSFFFGLTNCPANGWIWTAAVTSRPESGGTWDINLNSPTNFVFDLGTLNPGFIARLNTDQYLDVVVQDDTTVDYVQLRVWTCAPPSINPNGLTHFARGRGGHPPAALAVMPQPELAAFGPLGRGPALCVVPPAGHPTLRGSVEVGIGGGQAYGFTTILDLNAPEDSEIVISVPTGHGTNAPLFALVKAKCPPKCHWDLKPLKKFYDDAGGACRVASSTARGDVRGAFDVTEAQSAADSLLTLTPEAGVEQFPVSFLFDAATGEITVTFPGTVARRLCNGLPCPRGWDGTIKGRVDEAARRKGWDGVVKCPCYDENASRIVFTPRGTNPPPPRAAIEISSTGLGELTLLGEQLYVSGSRITALPNHGALFQSTSDGNGVVFTPLDELGGVSLDLGNAAGFSTGFAHFDTGDVPQPEQRFRLGGPKWPLGLTNRPPPPPIELRLAQSPAGLQCYVDFAWLNVTGVVVQLWTNGVLVGEGLGSGNALATNPVFLDAWPDRLTLSSLSDGLRLTSGGPLGVVGCCVGDELRILPRVAPGTVVPLAFSELQVRASAGLQSFVHGWSNAPADEPLLIHCPPDLVALTCRNAAPVEFSVTASGNSGAVVCQPPSGSLFPPGATMVTCTASNVFDNVTTCAFTVNVKPVPPGGDCVQVGIGIPFEPFGGATAVLGPPDESGTPALLVIPAAGTSDSGLRLVPGPAQSFRFTTVLDATAPVGAGFDLFLPPDPLHPSDPPLVSIRSKGPSGYCVKLNKGRAADPAEPLRAFAVNTNGDLLEPILFTPAEVDAIGVCDIGFVPGVSNCHVTIEVNLVDGRSSVEFDGPIVPVVPTASRHKGWDGCIYGPDRPRPKPPKTARLLMIPPPLPPGPPIGEAFLRVSGWPQMRVEEPSLTARGGGRKWSDGHVTLMKAYDDGVGQGVEFRTLTPGGGVQVALGHAASFEFALVRIATNLPAGEVLLTRTLGPIRGLTNRPPPPFLDALQLMRTETGWSCSADFGNLESPTVTVVVLSGGVPVAQRTGVPATLEVPLFTLAAAPGRLGKLGGPTPCRTVKFPSGLVTLPAGGGLPPEAVTGDECRVLAETPPGTPTPDYYTGLELTTTEGGAWRVGSFVSFPECAPLIGDEGGLQIRSGSNGLLITWPGETHRLQGATEVSGPWIDLGAVSPVVLVPNYPARFFRLVCD